MTDWAWNQTIERGIKYSFSRKAIFEYVEGMWGAVAMPNILWW